MHICFFSKIFAYIQIVYFHCAKKMHCIFVRWVEISLKTVSIVYEVPCENCERLRSGPVNFSLGNFPYLKQNFDPSSPMHCCNTGKKNRSSCQTLWKVIKINMSIDWNGHLKEIQKLWTLVLDLPIFKLVNQTTTICKKPTNQPRFFPQAVKDIWYHSNKMGAAELRRGIVFVITLL